MWLHIADVHCSRQDGGAGRALRHLGILVTSFPLWKSWQHFVLPGARPPKNNFLPVRRITKISTVHLFILNLTRAVWGLPWVDPQTLHSAIFHRHRQIVYTAVLNLVLDLDLVLNLVLDKFSTRLGCLLSSC